MKIGLVCPYNIFRSGGVQECVLALQAGITARGHEALVITPQPPNFKGPTPEGIILIGGSRPIRAARTEFDVSASVDIAALESVLASHTFDILHFHEPAVPMLSRQILSRSSAINIATFHAAPPGRGARAIETMAIPYGKSILKYLDVLTAVSPAAAVYIKTITKRRIHIIPNGIDLSKYMFRPVKRKARATRTILYIGRLEKRKGVKYLIEAFILLQHSQPFTRLIIVGDGPERVSLEDQANEAGIRNISFLGFIDEPAKLDLLDKADVFCSPALYGESFGIVLLEAMASGCVVVAGNNPGYESVLQGRGQLSIVNPKDAREFARRLMLLSEDEGLRNVWLEWAQAEVKKYEYTKVIDQYLALYTAAYAKKHIHEARQT